jgi:hypothetical protein
MLLYKKLLLYHTSIVQLRHYSHHQGAKWAFSSPFYHASINPWLLSLVVAVEWYGLKLKGDKTDVFVRNIDIIPIDNGQTTLKNELFDKIPQNAIGYLILLRGNIEVIKNAIDSSELYRLGAETHAVLPFIMIRNI